MNMTSLIIISYIVFSILVLCLHLLINLWSFYRLEDTTRENTKVEPTISILVPARNEESHIEMCVRSLVEQNYEQLEVLVLDDQSTDATAMVVQRIIDELQPSRKGRLRLLYGGSLPSGWVGKTLAVINWHYKLKASIYQ